MGKLIVIEGLDGSGKSTQIRRLRAYMEEQNIAHKQIKLPDYDDDSSTLVKMYLSGRFGSHPDDVNAYAASSFYAVDRFANFKQHWKDEYDEGKIIISDRYTTSNAVHQCSKLPKGAWDSYLDWLYDFEFNKIAIPRPDLVIFLDMDINISQKLLDERYNNVEDKKDIHERDLDYLARCKEAALYSANRLGWVTIKCDDGVNARAIDDIFADILSKVKKVIE